MLSEVSDCSLATNGRPRGQSQRVSVGILADKTAKQAGVSVTNPRKVSSGSQSKTVTTTKSHGITTTIRAKPTKDPGEERSPWISTRPFNEETPTMKAFRCLETASNLSVSTHVPRKISSVKDAIAKPSVHCFVNLDSHLQSSDVKVKKFSTVEGTGKLEMYETTECLKEYSVSSMQEDPCPSRGVTTDKNNKAETSTHETLKMKLWEILGNASSPLKQFSNSEKDVMDNTDNLNPEPKFEQKHNEVISSRQKSDTIETDSEVGPTIQRSVTRSLARKRKQSGVHRNKNKKGIPSGYKQKIQGGKNAFPNEEYQTRKLQCPANSGSLLEANKGEAKRSRIDPCKILFPRNKESNVIPQEAESLKAQSSEQKETSLFSNKNEQYVCSPLVNEMQKMEPHNEKNSHISPVIQNPRFGDLSSSPPLEMAPQKEKLCNLDMQNTWIHHDDFQSPAFGYGAPSGISSPISPPNTNYTEPGAKLAAAAEKQFTVADFASFGTFNISRPVFKSNLVEDTYDVTAESPTQKSVPNVEKQNIEDHQSTSSSSENDSESCDVGLCFNEEYAGCWGNKTVLPEIGTIKKSKFMLSPTKRMHKSFVFSPVSASPKGPEESEEFHVISEQNRDDGLGRVVSLFASTLERVQNKMKLVAAKKSSEIMVSTTEAVRLQLHNAGSQIQTDLVKLTSHNKSKRKHIEAKLLEKQDKLMSIHQKFKEEVNQHLSECCNTIESLEDHQKEFKGTIVKQRASHKKLVLQVEESLEMQLKDAERRMSRIQKLAKEKMVQLKLAVVECLKEDVFS